MAPGIGGSKVRRERRAGQKEGEGEGLKEIEKFETGFPWGEWFHMVGYQKGRPLLKEGKDVNGLPHGNRDRCL